VAADHELGRTQLSVVSAEDDPELDAVARTIVGSVRVSGRRALARWFGDLLAAQHGHDVAPRTLDLYGHSTARTAQLRLGDWVIDAVTPAEQAFFRALADRAVLARLGITSVRLLACRTADTEAGRATMCRLAEALGVEVYGTRHLLYDAHHDAQGFLAAWQFLLISTTELRRHAARSSIEAAPRTLALDALPTAPLGARASAPLGARSMPRWLVSPAAAAQILTLIRRDAGAPMPGMSAAPSCELVLASEVAGAYRVAHVLLDSAFLRFYPDGPGAPGVAYPVDDPGGLQRIMALCPPLD
jgi:hypothetical protein